jgi:hypothetical protein
MKIEATAKEIADLVLALQGQRSREISVLIGEKEVGRTTISDCLETMVNSFRSAIRDTDEEAQEA